MTIAAKFPGRCTRCNNTFPAGTPVEWTRGAGARHAAPEGCVAATQAVIDGHAAAAPEPVVAPLAPVADFLTAAKARGLKFPKARFLAPGQSEFRLSVAGDMSKAPGSIQVLLGGEWVGRVTPAGVVEGPLSRRPELIDALLNIAADPAAAAKAYGALMCRCSFCDKPLTDDGSVEVGYGPICARKFGLPHQPRGTRDLVATAVPA